MVEHLGHLLCVQVVLLLVGPGVAGVQDFGVHVVDACREGKVEDGESLVLGVQEAAVVDCVDDVTSGLDADALNKPRNTFPTP